VAGTVVNKVDVGGLTMTTLGKNTAWKNDALWGSLVAPTFKASLVVESWIGGEAEGPYCRPDHQYQVVGRAAAADARAGGQRADVGGGRRPRQVADEHGPGGVHRRHHQPHDVAVQARRAAPCASSTPSCTH
jgi:hypothetical protein